MTDTEQPLDALRSVRVTQPPPAMSTLGDQETPITVADTTVTVGLDSVLSTMTAVEPIGLLGELGAVLGGTTVGGRLPGRPGLVYRQPDQVQNRPGADSGDARRPRRRGNSRTETRESTGTDDTRTRPPPETPTTERGLSPTGMTDRPDPRGAGPGVPTAGHRPLPVVLPTNEPGSGAGDATAGRGRRHNAGRALPPAETSGPELRYLPQTAPEADDPVPPGTVTTADTTAGGPDAGVAKTPDTGSTEPPDVDDVGFPDVDSPEPSNVVDRDVSAIRTAGSPDGERPGSTGGGAEALAGSDRTPGGDRRERVTTATGSPGGGGGTGRTRLERLVERRHAGDAPDAQARTPVETGAPAGVAGVGERDAVTGGPTSVALPGWGLALTPGRSPEPGDGVDSANSNRTGRRQTGAGLTHLSPPEPVARGHHKQEQAQAMTGRETATPGEQPSSMTEPSRQPPSMANSGRQPPSTDALVDSGRVGAGRSMPADAVDSTGVQPGVAGRQRARPVFTHLSSGDGGARPRPQAVAREPAEPGWGQPPFTHLSARKTPAGDHLSSGGLSAGDSGGQQRELSAGEDLKREQLVHGGASGVPAATGSDPPSSTVRTERSGTTATPGRVGADEPGDGRTRTGAVTARAVENDWGKPTFTHLSPGGPPASDRPFSGEVPAGGRLSSGEPRMGDHSGKQPADADAGESRAGDSGERRRERPAERERMRGTPTPRIDPTVTSPGSVAGAGEPSPLGVTRVDATRDVAGGSQPRSRPVATGAVGRWPETPRFTHLSPAESPGEGSISPTESPGEGSVSPRPEESSDKQPRRRPPGSEREQSGLVGAGASGVPVMTLSGRPAGTVSGDSPDRMAVPGEHREGATTGSATAQPRSRTVGSGWGQPTFTHLSPGGPRVGDSAERPSARTADRTGDAPGGEPDAGAVPGGAMGRPGPGSGEVDGVDAQSGRDGGPTRGQSPGFTHLLLPAGADGTGPARTTAPRDGPPVLSVAGRRSAADIGSAVVAAGAELETAPVPGQSVPPATDDRPTATPSPGGMPLLPGGDTTDGVQPEPGKDLIDETTQNRAPQAEDMPSLTLQSTGTQRVAGSTGTQRAAGSTGTQRADRAADTERSGAGTAAGSNQGRQTGGTQRSGPRTDHARRVERSLEPEPDRTQHTGDGRAETRDDAAKTDLTVKTLAPRVDATRREDSPRDITHTGQANRNPQSAGESVDVESLFRAAEGGSDRPPAAVDQLVERLYRRIERKMRIERERRGL